MTETAVSLKDVWLKYRIEFKECGRTASEDIWVLKEINLEVSEGECVAIIGENGAGKTTLLKIIAGMLKPDKGAALVKGRVSALMDIGAGFQEDLTGRENIYLTSSLFGLSREEIDKRLPDIINFADIGKFINAQVRVYSQGMYMRLAFAIAIHVDPDILLVDDIFAVGDLYAQRKCIDKMFELKKEGKTILFVTHDLETARLFCERGLFFKDGRLVKDGTLKEVSSFYLRTVGSRRGIGILQGKRLGAVFNNGRLILTWDEEPLTKEWGGYSMVSAYGKPYLSFESDWELVESSSDRIVLDGSFWYLPLKQRWEVMLDEDSQCVDIRIAMQSRQDVGLEEISAGLMLRPAYRRWMTPYKNKEFEAKGANVKAPWECIDSHSPAVSFVGLSCDPKADKLPSVVMSDEVYVPGKLLEVQTAASELDAQVLKSKITAEAAPIISERPQNQCLFDLKLRIFDDLLKRDDYLRSLPEGLLPKSIKHGELSLSASANNIGIYLAGRKLTSSQGLQVHFCNERSPYPESDYETVIHKRSESGLDISRFHRRLPFHETWRLELAQGVISCRVSMQARQQMPLSNIEFRCLLDAAYNAWFAGKEKGMISGETEARDTRDLLMKNDPSNTLGVYAQASGIELPQIVLSEVSGITMFNSLKKLFDQNSRDSDGMIIRQPTTTVYFLHVQSKDNAVVSKGEHLLFDIRICAGGDGGLKPKKEDCANGLARLPSGSKLISEQLLIESGVNRIVFEKGRCRIFYKDKELTKNFGLYTSIYSEDFYVKQWYSSLDALWEKIAYKKGRLLVRGIWPYLPISQTWELRSVRNGFHLNVDMEVFAGTSMERQQTNIMISDSYYRWSCADACEGEFPEGFGLLGWEEMLRKTGERLSVSCRDTAGLPAVSFSCEDKGQYEVTAENSNQVYKSRSIGFEKVSRTGKEVGCGAYKYFSGLISIDKPL